jgi:hypothetical protein
MMKRRKDMNAMHRLRAALMTVLMLGAAVGCSTQTSPGDIITGQVFPEMAVGTLNDSAGTISGLNGGPGPGTYANVVTSFRNNLGASAFQHPGNGMLHLPGAVTIPVGGLFSYGQPPGANGIVGLPPAYVPPSAVGGYATGYIFTGAPATPGAYSWTTVVVVNGQNQPYGASATMPASPTVLGAEAPPVYASGGATGGGTFTVTVPAGVSETLVVVFDSTPAEVATTLTHSTSATLPPGTLTPGSAYTAFAIGADYPFVEAGPPASVATMPTLTGGGGTADMTVSSSSGFVQ